MPDFQQRVRHGLTPTAALSTLAKLGRVCALMLMAGLGAQAAHAGVITGTINNISTNKVWAGVLVQLTGSATYGDCGTSWAYFAINDPMHSAWLATLLTAKATGAAVTITTTGCAVGVPGVVAQMTVLEYK